MAKLHLKYLLSLVLGGVLVWLAFRGEDWGQVIDRLGAVDQGYVWAYVALFALAHLLRMFRWGVLVRALGPIKWSRTLAAGAVGYMCIMVLPLRLGEFVRPVLVRGHGGVTASGALATVVVERVIDGILFVALFFVFVTILPASNHPAVGTVKAGAYVAGAVFFVTLLVLVGAYLQRDATLRFLRRVGYAIHKGLADRALHLLEAFLDGLKVLPDWRRLGLFMLYTFIYWAALGYGMKLMGAAVQMDDLTWTGGFALLTVLTVGIMVPGGPGFAGTFEFALKGGFALLVLSNESRGNITVYILLLHAAQLLVQVGFGALYLLLGAVKLSDLRQAE